MLSALISCSSFDTIAIKYTKYPADGPTAVLEV